MKIKYIEADRQRQTHTEMGEFHGIVCIIETWEGLGVGKQSYLRGCRPVDWLRVNKKLDWGVERGPSG